MRLASGKQGPAMFGRKIIAELAEVGENLFRSQLTAAQEASAIFWRKAIYEELHRETKAGAALCATLVIATRR